MRTHPSLKRLIPLTPLRHFYRVIESACFDFRLQTATELLRKPAIIQTLVRKSSEHFALYQNSNEAFHNRAVSGLSPNQLSSPVASSNLSSVIVAGNHSIPNYPSLDFDFVDYEVNPLRTTGSFFENGKSGNSSGTGGVDLLLAQRPDKFPIVGEVKVESDKDPFFALIQALTYAVELTTQPQRQRLNFAYGNQLKIHSDGPFIDIYVVLVAYPKSKDRMECLRLTNELSQTLLKPSSPVAGLVRRIVCIETPPIAGNIRFSVNFAYDSNGPIPQSIP